MTRYLTVPEVVAINAEVVRKFGANVEKAQGPSTRRDGFASLSDALRSG